MKENLFVSVLLVNPEGGLRFKYNSHDGMSVLVTSSEKDLKDHESIVREKFTNKKPCIKSVFRGNLDEYMKGIFNVRVDPPKDKLNTIAMLRFLAEDEEITEVEKKSLHSVAAKMEDTFICTLLN